MATRTVTYDYTVCDGCGKNTRDDEIEILQSQRTIAWSTISNTIDVCGECTDQDKYICRHCAGVHNDDDPCTKVAEMIHAKVEPSQPAPGPPKS